MNILLLTAHSIAEFDDLRMLHELGYNVFSIGAYTNPAEPTDDKRPALLEVPYHADLAAACEQQRRDMEAAHGSPGANIDWAKARLPDAVLEWADTVICHHFPERWIAGHNWDRYQEYGVRVIWRTCGQSNPALEQFMASGRPELQIVRYSPKERNLPNYAGEDAVIRFGKEPDEWCGWRGDIATVGNLTQNMKQRGDACGYGFWQAATDGLPVMPAGPGSEEIGGLGSVPYDRMHAYLRSIRVYLYTGTQPASYTLGLIEAMMTGVPVVSIGPQAFGPGWIGEVFEGHEIADVPQTDHWDNFYWDVENWSDDPQAAGKSLRQYLDDWQLAKDASAEQRQRAINLFGMDGVKRQWREFLG